MQIHFSSRISLIDTKSGLHAASGLGESSWEKKTGRDLLLMRKEIENSLRRPKSPLFIRRIFFTDDRH
jgi:hypothetical protein